MWFGTNEFLCMYKWFTSNYNNIHSNMFIQQHLLYQTNTEKCFHSFNKFNLRSTNKQDSHIDYDNDSLCNFAIFSLTKSLLTVSDESEDFFRFVWCMLEFITRE